MSLKTLRSSNDSAIAQTTKRFALRRLYAACVAGLLGFAPTASFALELGDATIRSSLGQALHVEIPYRLAGGEQLTPACIGLVAPAQASSTLPAYTRASRVSITATHIEIFGSSRVLEPLIGVTVDVRCGTAPRFVRSYELFVDLPTQVQASSAPASRYAAGAQLVAERPRITAPEARSENIDPASDRATASAQPATPRATASARARGQSGGALAQGQTYVVVRGDTLSGIAARVGDRPSIRETADAIFAANPEAFTRGNPDLLEAGRSLTIPLMTAAPPAQPAASSAAPLAEPIEAGADVAPPAAPSSPPIVPTSEAAPAMEPNAEAAEAPAPVEAVPEPATTPAAVVVAANTTPADAQAPEPAGRTSWWVTAVLALAAAVAVSLRWRHVRRRQDEDPQPEPKRNPARERRLVDPAAGFDVVEGALAREPAAASQRAPANPQVEVAFNTPRAADGASSATQDVAIGPVDAVDLDVGAPVTGDQDVDWFGDRSVADPIAKADAQAALEDAATVRMQELETAATLRQQRLAREASVADATINDEQHTLTIVELDMLRQDYEAEHTLTQANQALRDAVADLKATQAARAAHAETSTLEMPQQPQEESLETQPTQRLRSSR